MNFTNGMVTTVFELSLASVLKMCEVFFTLIALISLFAFSKRTIDDIDITPTNQQTNKQTNKLTN